MKITEVIPSKHWKNTKTGATASIYGAAPYVSDADAVNWEVVVSGWSWRLDNGTVGLGRQPVKTYEEAVEVMDRFNKL